MGWGAAGSMGFLLVFEISFGPETGTKSPPCTEDRREEARVY